MIFGLSFGILASLLSVLIGASIYIFNMRVTLSLQLIAFAIEYLYLYIHFNYSVSEKLNPYILASFSIFLGIFLVYSIKYMFIPLTGYDELFWDIGYNVIGIISFFYISYVLFASYRYSREIEALIQGIGTMFLVIGFMVGLGTTTIIREFLNLNFEGFYADIAKAIGALLFISIFAFNVNFVERISIDTHGILVFDSSGRQLGFFNIKTKQKIQTDAIPVDPSLFTALVSALLTFTKEALGSKGFVKSISGEDKAVIFEMGESIHTALITEKSTRLLNLSMRNFRNNCEEIIKETPQHEYHVGLVDEDKIKTSLRLNFPYIEIID